MTIMTTTKAMIMRKKAMMTRKKAMTIMMTTKVIRTKHTKMMKKAMVLANLSGRESSVLAIRRTPG